MLPMMFEDNRAADAFQSGESRGRSPGRSALPWLGVALLAAAVFYWGHERLTLETVKSGMEGFQGFVRDHYALSVAAYLLAYLLVGLAFLPGAIALALLGGYLYGFLPATVYVLAGLNLGAACGFYLARRAVGARIQRRYEKPLRWFNEEIRRYGHYVLFVFRLLPLLPFSLVNYFSGLTRIPFTIYITATVLGELPGTLLCTYAGRQLAAIERVEDVFTPRVLVALSLAAIFALLPVFFSVYERLRGIR